MTAKIDFFSFFNFFLFFKQPFSFSLTVFLATSIILSEWFCQTFRLLMYLMDDNSPVFGNYLKYNEIPIDRWAKMTTYYCLKT